MKNFWYGVLLLISIGLFYTSTRLFYTSTKLFLAYHNQQQNYIETPVPGMVVDKFIANEGKNGVYNKFEVYVPQFHKNVVISVRSSTYDKFSVGDQATFQYSKRDVYGNDTVDLIDWLILLIIGIIVLIVSTCCRFGIDIETIFE